MLKAMAGCAFFVASTALVAHELDFHRQLHYRRLWSDLAVAISGYINHVSPPVNDRPADPDAPYHVRHMILTWIDAGQLRPTQLFETLRAKVFLRGHRLRAENNHYDDRGRSVLLEWAFRLRGGIAPFLIVWLGPLLALPVIFWSSLELSGAGLRRAAGAWPLILGLVPFIPEALALTRYAVGFYVIATLLIVPVAVYAVANERPSVRGLLVRMLAASVWFTLCVFCRSSVVLLLPGFVLALGIGLVRAEPSWPRRLGWGVLALTLFLAPLPLARTAQESDVWQPLWEGLGDYDRTKGYTWSDTVALEAARRRGATQLWTPESEAIFRQDVLYDVGEDPMWYLGILGQRLFATLTLERLWPWAPRDGRALRRNEAPNEGVIDKYWRYSATIDYAGLGRSRVELPVTLVLAPTVLLLAWAAWRRSRPAGFALAVGCIAVATIVLPVCITTAGGVETQSFAIAHLFSAALLFEALPARRPAADVEI